VRVRIILVEPRESGNIGAAARAMANFGFSELVLVGDRAKKLDPASEWWAKGGERVLHDARRVDTLEEALTDVHLSVATTAVRGRQVFEQLTPFDLARLAESLLGDEQTLALVFGREEWGLSGREIALCQRTASIATSPHQPTLNLAQAVSIFCYELGKGLRSPAKAHDAAPGELLHHLNTRSRQLMIDVGFFGDKSPDRMCAELLALAGRAVLTTREASLLLSFVAHVENALKR
jgi:TrmH family RNA methyltransferase